MLIEFFCLCCSFLLNGKGVDRRTNVFMVCLYLSTYILKNLLSPVFKGVTSVFYLCHFLFQDTGPQMPTIVSGMLKFGTNLLQAVGQFNGEQLKLVFPFLSSWLSMYVSYGNHYHFEGHYVILVAYLSFRSLPEHPALQDYVQPAVTSVDSGNLDI